MVHDAGGGVGDRVGVRVVDAGRGALVRLPAGDRDRRALGLARHLVRRRVRVAGQRAHLAGAHAGVVAHRLHERAPGRGERLQLGGRGVELGQLGVGAEEQLAGLGVVQAEAGERSVGSLQRGDVVARRSRHGGHRLALDLGDRLRPADHVAGAVVGERRVRRVEHRVDAEHGEEEQPRQEVLHRDEAPWQVHDVEGDERRAEDRGVAPRLLVDRRDHPGDGDGVGEPQQQDLGDPARRRGPEPVARRGDGVANGGAGRSPDATVASVIGQPAICERICSAAAVNSAGPSPPRSVLTSARPSEPHTLAHLRDRRQRDAVGAGLAEAGDVGIVLHLVVRRRQRRRAPTRLEHGELARLLAHVVEHEALRQVLLLGERRHHEALHADERLRCAAVLHRRDRPDGVGHAGGREAVVGLADRPRAGDGERRLAGAERVDHRVVGDVGAEQPGGRLLLQPASPWRDRPRSRCRRRRGCTCRRRSGRRCSHRTPTGTAAGGRHRPRGPICRARPSAVGSSAWAAL